MTETLPTILKRNSPAALAARPLLAGAQVIRAGVIDELESIDDDLYQLRQQAHQTLEEAKEQARQVLEDARNEGRKEGYEEWIREIARARAEYGRLQDAAEKDMVKLAFHIAQRLVGHAIEVRPEVVLDMVGKALVMARGRRQIVVKVNPEDYAQVETNRHEYARDLDGVPVYFEADPGLERGGCVIETEGGRIDARLQTQLDVLREALMKEDF